MAENLKLVGGEDGGGDVAVVVVVAGSVSLTPTSRLPWHPIVLLPTAHLRIITGTTLGCRLALVCRLLRDLCFLLLGHVVVKHLLLLRTHAREPRLNISIFLIV